MAGGAALLLGCATYQNVAIESDPPGSDVYLDGEKVGQTPLTLEIRRTQAHSVFLKHDGYRSELAVLELHDSADGIDFLSPPDIFGRLARGTSEDPAEMDRRLRIEVDESDGDSK